MYYRRTGPVPRPGTSRRRLLLCLTLPLLAFTAAADNGYRGIPYKAPTPISVEGATTLHFADDVKKLIKSSNVVLINVSPLTLSPPDDNGNRIWIPKRGKTMYNIPGSVWLPNVGYQSLDAQIRGYLEDNLHKLSDGNKERPLLFYCTADCWMSWNTVKRVSRELGYSRVYWYPSGIDGWMEQQFETEVATPLPFN